MVTSLWYVERAQTLCNTLIMKLCTKNSSLFNRCNMINLEKSEIYNKLGCDAAAKGNGTFCSFEKIREPKAAEKTLLEKRSL